jgi:hypothetical protein
VLLRTFTSDAELIHTALISRTVDAPLERVHGTQRARGSFKVEANLVEASLHEIWPSCQATTILWHRARQAGSMQDSRIVRAYPKNLACQVRRVRVILCHSVQASDCNQQTGCPDEPNSSVTSMDEHVSHALNVTMMPSKASASNHERFSLQRRMQTSTPCATALSTALGHRRMRTKNFERLLNLYAALLVCV